MTKNAFDQTPNLTKTFDQVRRSSEIWSSEKIKWNLIKWAIPIMWTCAYFIIWGCYYNCHTSEILYTILHTEGVRGWGGSWNSTPPVKFLKNFFIKMQKMQNRWTPPGNFSRNPWPRPGFWQKLQVPPPPFPPDFQPVCIPYKWKGGYNNAEIEV